MNTTNHIETAQALRRLAEAHEALAPYWGDGTYLDAPIALMNEYAEAILGIPAGFGEKLECLEPGAWGQQVAWARQQLERRDYPEFFALLAEMGRIRDAEGEEALHSDKHSGLFVKLLRCAPPRHKAEAYAILEEGLPQATHVDDQGSPVFSAEQIAQKFGVPVEKVEANIARMQREGLMDGCTYSGPVHQLQ